MNFFIRTIFYLYRSLLAPVLNRFSSCRYEPSCSYYMEQAINRHGFKGFIMGVKRIGACHPFSKRPIYDPVEEREEK